MNDQSQNYSITDALKEDTLVSEADLHEYQDDLRRAERERLQSGQKRSELLQSLRKSIQSVNQPPDEQKDLHKEFKRLCRDGYANEIESLITRYQKQLRTLQTKRAISQKTEQTMQSFVERLQVFLGKKQMLQKVEKALDHLSAGGEENLDEKSAIQVTRLRHVATSIRSDLGYVMEDLLEFFTKIETDVSFDMENEESIRTLFTACLSTLEDQHKRKVMRLCKEKSKEGTYEKRIAFYKNLIEQLVKVNRGAARIVHSQARKKARKYMKEGKYKLAVSELCYALHLYRDDPETYRALANVFFRQQDEKNGYTALKEVLRLCPEDHSLRKRMADYWCKKGDFKQAAEAYEILVEAFPDSWSYRRELGNMLFQKKEYARVPEVLKPYIQRQEADWDSVKLIAFSYVYLKKWEDAIPYLTTLKENRVDDVIVLQYLTIAYQRLQLHHEAVDVLREGIEANPDSSSLKILLGTIYVELEMWEEALETLLPVLETNVKSTSLLLAVSQSFLALGKHEEAIERLQQARKINPNEGEIYVMLARAYRGEANSDEARTAYEKALELQNGDPALLEELAAFYAENGMWEEATCIVKKLKNKKS